MTNNAKPNMDQTRWCDLMTRLGLSDNLDTLAQLQQAYANPKLAYHTTKHIEACLSHFDQTQHLLHQPALVECALWFHDAVYVPLKKDNELKSAQWAKQFLLDGGAEPDAAQTVDDLIMTTLHDGKPQSHDAQLLVDIDLSILGASREVYEQFERNIRIEYHMVPAPLFEQRRKSLLTGFLNRDTIYATEHFIQQREHSARENLAWAIEQL